MGLARSRGVDGSPEPLLELSHRSLEERLIGRVVRVIPGIGQRLPVDREGALDPCPGRLWAVAPEQKLDPLGLWSRLNGHGANVWLNTYTLETLERAKSMRSYRRRSRQEGG